MRRRRYTLLSAGAQAPASAVSMCFPVEPMMSLDPAALPGLERAFFFFLDEDKKDADETPSKVRTICIDGPLVHRFSWWWCSYEEIAEEFQEALDDPACEAIVLRINSPGGYAAGMGETVRAMQAAKVAAGKPVLAYADEMACSAAYGLACVADEIWLPPSGSVGSVGTILTVYDETEANKKMGLRVEVIASGEQKTDGHPDVPLTSAALGRMRERVMTLAGLFVGQVAEARRMTPEAVVDLKAGVYLGATAIEKGLANRLGNLAETLAEAARRGASAAEARASAGTSAPRPPTSPGQSAPQPNETTTMKILLQKLGLPETATEAEALVALAAQTDVQQKLLTLTKTSNPQAALGAVQAWKDGSAQTAALKAQLEGVQKAKEDSEKAALCDQLRAKGYSKAQVEQLAASMNLDGLRGYASVATKQSHAEEQREPVGANSPAGAAPGGLTAEERQACALLGLSEEDFLKEKKLLAQSQKGVN